MGQNSTRFSMQLDETKALDIKSWDQNHWRCEETIERKKIIPKRRLSCNSGGDFKKSSITVNRHR